MLVMKIDKQHITDGMELTNQDKIRTLGEKETYKYFVILETDTIKLIEMKENIKKRIFQANQKATRDKTIQQKTYQRNKYMDCILVRYLGPCLKVTGEELRQMEHRTKKNNDHA